MQRISVFDMLKIGVGPSSSHTMGPWRAAQRFLRECDHAGHLDQTRRLTVDLFGSLAKTGKGHGTDIAVLMGLSGADPVTCDTTQIATQVETIYQTKNLTLHGQLPLYFDAATDLLFHFDRTLPYHPNGLRFTAELRDGSQVQSTFYSVGGGFVVAEGEDETIATVTLPYPCDTAEHVREHCQQAGLAVSAMVWQNELVWRSAADVRGGLLRLWQTMLASIYRGCHTTGELPGGLRVVRRASQFYQRLSGSTPGALPEIEPWLEAIQQRQASFAETVQWISCFALAVNEENAAFGRVVTAPTNGAAGVVPAVLMHYVCTYQATDDDIIRFLLVAGEIASLFKKGATISAAMGGCQAEIGVSSAMAAAALTECLGGTVDQVLMAAEIAMEHHLGLTCDPIRGLVQIPCIERNAIGAMKAITACGIALGSSPQTAKVTLDGVIRTMWATARDMNERYKETAEGGLAVHIPVNLAEC